MWHRLFWSTCCSLLLALAPTGANALSKYDKTHTWDLRLKGAEGYGVTWQGQATALAANPSTTATHSVSQAPRPAPTNNTTELQSVAAGGASADAIAFYTANANGTGSHTLRGVADLGKGTVAISSARSTIGLRKTAPDAKGHIIWKGDWLIDTLKSARETDPLSFSVFNLDLGTEINSDLFSFDVDLREMGMAAWQNGIVKVDGQAGHISIVMDSPYITTGTGRLDLTFEGGVVTASDDSGVFDGLLPMVGAASNFSFALGDANGIDIGFDFGDANVAGYSVNLDIAVEAQVAEVPEASTHALMALGLAGGLVALRQRRREPGRVASPSAAVA